MSNYDILGLKKGATNKEIKVKFRALCKIHHPDMGGDSAKFIVIQAAYEALLKGDSGEKPQYRQGQQYNPYQHDPYAQQRAQQQQQRVKKGGEYRFDSIKKNKDNYSFKFYLWNITTVEVTGKDGNWIGEYDVRDVDGLTTLGLSLEHIKKANYVVRFTLRDGKGNSATKSYKIKKPTLWDKIKDMFN